MAREQQRPVRMYHPDTGGVTTTNRRAYEETYSARGWLLVDDDDVSDGVLLLEDEDLSAFSTVPTEGSSTSGDPESRRDQ